MSAVRDEPRPSEREKLDQAAARAGIYLARWFELPRPERRDLQRARQALDEALELTAGNALKSVDRAGRDLTPA